MVMYPHQKRLSGNVSSSTFQSDFSDFRCHSIWWKSIEIGNFCATQFLVHTADLISHFKWWKHCFREKPIRTWRKVENTDNRWDFVKRSYALEGSCESSLSNSYQFWGLRCISWTIVLVQISKNRVQCQRMQKCHSSFLKVATAKENLNI